MISSTAIFASADVAATLAFYKDVLGFESSWQIGEPPTFGSASVGGVTIMFCLQPELAAKVGGHQHWIKVDDADTLYDRHRAAGATIVSAIDNMPWGSREYVVEDPAGYHLRFAGPPVNEPARSQPFPEGVTIERRLPTVEEYADIAGRAFSYKELQPEILQTTWGGVVAIAPGGETVGVVRIVRDAPGWFSIWDVAVLPEWQARRIGSEMMKAALAMIREASPGANVHLFTYQHGFYDRLGFKKETVSMIRV
ncbi:MAG: hypothetical protein HONBIEJF_00928 [Fimbriimonadaceae bacterium]|nr:hypothetical protein [Fimbriimonadaceae bacterium]